MIIHNLTKFHQNKILRSPLIVFTDKVTHRQTDRHTDKSDHNTPSQNLWRGKKKPHQKKQTKNKTKQNKTKQKKKKKKKLESICRVQTFSQYIFQIQKRKKILNFTRIGQYSRNYVFAWFYRSNIEISKNFLHILVQGQKLNKYTNYTSTKWWRGYIFTARGKKGVTSGCMLYTFNASDSEACHLPHNFHRMV